MTSKGNGNLMLTLLAMLPGFNFMILVRGNQSRSTMYKSEMSNKTTTTIPPDEFIAENDTNKALVTASGGLSVIGSSIIILTYLSWKSIRTTSRLLLVYISLGDFLTAGTNVLSTWQPANGYRTTPICIATATVNTIAVLSTFFWTTFLAIYLYLAICRQMESRTEIKVLFVFHLVGWGVPATIVFTALGLNKIGNTEDITSAGWCWIKHSKHVWDMVLWMILAGKGWELLAYIAIVVFYAKVKVYISKQMKVSFEIKFYILDYNPLNILMS